MVADSTSKGATAIQRLVEASPGKSIASLAEVLGVTTQAIYNARNKGNIPPAWYISVADKSDISLDWLYRGERLVTGEGKVDGLVMVPKVAAKLCAGNGSLINDDEIKARYAFRSDWIHSKGTPSRMVLMDLWGDSMMPQLQDGDTLLVDQSQDDLIAGKLYAIGVDDQILVREFVKQPGCLVFKAKDSDYEPIRIGPRPENSDQPMAVRIIGRIVWWCREAR